MHRKKVLNALARAVGRSGTHLHWIEAGHGPNPFFKNKIKFKVHFCASNDDHLQNWYHFAYWITYLMSSKMCNMATMGQLIMKLWTNYQITSKIEPIIWNIIFMYFS